MSESDGDPIESIRAQLEQLRTAVRGIPTPPPTPEPTLSILGAARSETSWEAFLAYFLDPSAPHGMDTDVLEAFLRAVSATTDSRLAPRSHRLSAVAVESQVAADDGVPDLLLWVPDEWFCCIELKSHSGESEEQTLRYAASEGLGPLAVADFDPADRHYVYLAPAASPAPASDDFAVLDWEAVVEAVRTVLGDHRGRYPVRSSAQLADFLDTVDDELNMTDQERYRREKAQLAVDHSDAIDAVLGALEAVVDDERSSWQDDFADVADASWNTALAGQKYARAYRDEWVLGADADDGTPALVYELQIDADALRGEAVQIELKRNSGSAAPDRVADALYAESVQADLASLAPRHDVRIRGRSDRVHTLEADVSVDLAAGDTVGGRFATRIAELAPINGVLDGVVADLD